MGVKCDLCNGRELPACVEACPTHALVFAEMKAILGMKALKRPEDLTFNSGRVLI